MITLLKHGLTCEMAESNNWVILFWHQPVTVMTSIFFKLKCMDNKLFKSLQNVHYKADI